MSKKLYKIKMDGYFTQTKQVTTYIEADSKDDALNRASKKAHYYLSNAEGVSGDHWDNIPTNISCSLDDYAIVSCREVSDEQ